jgi:superfamily II DNA or RNA helicase
METSFMLEQVPKLHGYQEAGIRALKDEQTLFYAVDMGLGKTRMVLETIRDTGARALVVAPLRPLYSTWPAEIKKWCPELSYRIIHGPDKLAAAKDKRDVQVTLINYEGLKWYYQKQMDKVIPVRKYDFTALDESSMIKSWKAQRFKILQAMDSILGPMRVNMSATPMPNGYHELWSQMWMLDHGAALGEKISHFTSKYFTYTGPPRYDLLLREGAGELIQEAVKHKFFRLKAEDYLRMVDPIINTIEFDLPPKVMKMYRDFKKDAVLQLDKQTTITAVSAGAAANKLRQISQGALYHEDGKTFTEMHTRRLEALKAIQQENEGAPLLVACQFKFEVAMLKRAFGDIPVIAGGTPAPLAAQYLNQWNRGELPILVCHPASLSHGVNLQDGGRIIVWYGLTWSLEQYIQFIGRLHRQGQKFGVIIHHIIARGTVDKRVLHALNVKDQTQSGFLEAIKQALYE